jgi:hypothetical protein
MDVEHQDLTVKASGFQSPKHLTGPGKRFDLEAIAPNEPLESLPQ